MGFIEELNKLAKEYDMTVKNGEVIKVYKTNIDVIKMANVGLEDALEVAYTTAEHHPYWGLLYHTLEISKRILERWDTNLDEEDLDEIAWRIEELKHTLNRLRG
ncbi:MAG: hypothetical protein QW416_05410 [Candidatus Nitrosocaldaceae archaeon]